MTIKSVLENFLNQSVFQDILRSLVSLSAMNQICENDVSNLVKANTWRWRCFIENIIFRFEGNALTVFHTYGEGTDSLFLSISIDFRFLQRLVNEKYLRMKNLKVYVNCKYCFKEFFRTLTFVFVKKKIFYVIILITISCYCMFLVIIRKKIRIFLIL